jgi:hypothetical protein
MPISRADVAYSPRGALPKARTKAPSPLGEENMMLIDAIQRSRGRYRILTAVMVVALAVCGVQATSRAGQPGPLVTSSEGRGTGATPTSGPSTATESPATEGDYASREASAKGLEDFKGGDVVIVGSAGLVIVLLVILIIVLL